MLGGPTKAQKEDPQGFEEDWTQTLWDRQQACIINSFADLLSKDGMNETILPVDFEHVPGLLYAFTNSRATNGTMTVLHCIHDSPQAGMMRLGRATAGHCMSRQIRRLGCIEIRTDDEVSDYIVKPLPEGVRPRSNMTLEVHIPEFEKLVVSLSCAMHLGPA